MSGFQGYDQWKTASPYDDYDDEHCHYCGVELPDDTTDLSDEVENAIMDGYCKPECQVEGDKGNISPRFGLPPAPNEAQHARIRDLWDRIGKCKAVSPATFEEFSETCDFPDGDFKWDNDDPGDAHVYCCGERDCPVQWHLAFYCETIERKDGKLSVEIHDGDSDGNWDINTSWEEGDDWDACGVGYHFGKRNLDSYFKGWAEYWIDAAETGKDPCDQSMTRPQPDNKWVDFCLDAAERNVECLEPKEKKK